MTYTTASIHNLNFSVLFGTQCSISTSLLVQVGSYSVHVHTLIASWSLNSPIIYHQVRYYLVTLFRLVIYVGAYSIKKYTNVHITYSTQCMCWYPDEVRKVWIQYQCIYCITIFALALWIICVACFSIEFSASKSISPFVHGVILSESVSILLMTQFLVSAAVYHKVYCFCAF